MTAEGKKSSVGYWIWLVVGLAFMFLFGMVCPAWSTVTPMGVSMIGIFVGLLILITSTGQLIWPSLAALFATVICGYMSGADAIAKFMGTSTILQVIAILVICSALRETGAGKVLAKKIVTAKAIQGKPLLFTAVFLLAFLYADIFLDTFGGIIFSLTVFESVREALGYEKNNRYTQAMTLGLYLCGMLGAALIPFTPMTLAITGAFGAAIEPYGYTFNPAMYIVAAIVVGTVFMIVYSLMIKFIFRCDLSRLKDLNPNEIEALKDTSSKFNKKQVIYLVAFLFGIAYSFVLHFLSKDSSIYVALAPITQALWFVLVIVILSIVKIDGEPLMDCKKHFAAGANWGFIATIGVFMIIGGALSSNDLGVKTWLAEVLTPLFSGMPLPLFILIIVLATAIITNVFSNMATGIIVSGVTMPFTVVFAAQGVDPSIIAAAIAYTSMFAFMTYAAAGPAPLLLGREGIETKFIWTKGLMTLAAYVVVAAVLFSLLGLIL